MISQVNRSRLVLISIVSGFIVLFDIFTIISNIYVAPILEGYGLPDIFIYLKLVIFLTIFFVSFMWLTKKGFNLTKDTLKILIVLGVSILILYFISVYLYKYILIIETADIIKDRILNGNPATYLDFSGINYRTLMYILTIFGGFNSELVLFFEGMLLFMLLNTVNQVEIEVEPLHQYDTFMYEAVPTYLPVLWVVVSFLSINILLYRFDILGSIEMGVAVLAFLFVTASLPNAYGIFRHKNMEVSKSAFVGKHRFILTLSIASILLYVFLFGLNVYFVTIGRETYRIVSSLLALVISISIAIRVKRILNLENK